MKQQSLLRCSVITVFKHLIVFWISSWFLTIYKFCLLLLRTILLSRIHHLTQSTRKSGVLLLLIFFCDVDTRPRNYLNIYLYQRFLLQYGPFLLFRTSNILCILSKGKEYAYYNVLNETQRKMKLKEVNRLITNLTTG